MKHFITKRMISILFSLSLIIGCFAACQGDVQTDMPSTTISPKVTVTLEQEVLTETTDTPTSTEEVLPTEKPEPTPTAIPVATPEPTATPEPEVKENVILESIKDIDESFIGNYVLFGAYEQDNIFENGPEKIEWLILDIKDGKALLLSKYGLDCMAYHNSHVDITWEKSMIRKWLNKDFYSTAFTEEEQKSVSDTMLINHDNILYGTEGGNDTIDKVFLLSANEAVDFFHSEAETKDPKRRAYATEYSKTKGWIYYESDLGLFGSTEYDGTGLWLLRTPGQWGVNIQHVNLSGSVVNVGTAATEDTDNLIRPALWVNIN